MQYIDFHSHVYPPAIARKATVATCDFYDLVSPYVGTPEEKRALDGASGITHSLILPVAVLPRLVRSCNLYAAETAKKDPHFIAFGTVHAADENITDELAGFEELGLCGVKLHPDMQRFNIDDERLFPLYDAVQGKLPVMFHSGDFRTQYSRPARIRRVMDMFPRLTVIAAHLGAWSLQEEAFPLLKDKENLFVDTCSSMSHMAKERAMKYIRGYGVERVFFGSDYPVEDPVYQIKVLETMPLTDDEKERIAHLNAEAFLREFCGRQIGI
ncbi:MAG: amidohydrolase family protein [Clostridia bacterium]|nr:amidohydrolase family protein [Clostridia bacterium]